MYAAKDITDRPVPIRHPFFAEIEPLTIGLLRVRTIKASFSASTTCPKHWVDMAIVYVANMKVREGNNPTVASGAK